MRWVSANGVNFLGQLYAIPMLQNDLNGLEFVGQMNALLSVELERELLGPLFGHHNNLKFMISMRGHMGKV
ncbi:hypothetical protein MPDQ_005913, partial [Monascus purpureus]